MLMNSEGMEPTADEIDALEDVDDAGEGLGQESIGS